MKKLFIITLLLLVVTLLNGQITLEKSYSHSGTLTDIGEGEYKYFVMDVPLKQCRLYNEDHTLYRTFNLNVPQGYFLYDIQFLSRNLFNDDALIELLYIYYKVTESSGTDVYSYGLKVVNENGTVLLSQQDGGHAEIVQGSDGPKLLAYKYIYYDYYYLVYTDVYNLGGSATLSMDNQSSSLRLFPNPTSSDLYIQPSGEEMLTQGTVHIFDNKGAIIWTQSYNMASGPLKIAASALDKGIYSIRVSDKAGSTVTKIFEKL